MKLLTIALKEVLLTIDNYSQKCNSPKDRSLFNELNGIKYNFKLYCKFNLVSIYKVNHTEKLKKIIEIFCKNSSQFVKRHIFFVNWLRPFFLSVLIMKKLIWTLSKIWILYVVLFRLCWDQCIFFFKFTYHTIQKIFVTDEYFLYCFVRGTCCQHFFRYHYCFFLASLLTEISVT